MYIWIGHNMIIWGLSIVAAGLLAGIVYLSYRKAGDQSGIVKGREGEDSVYGPRQ